MRLVVFVLALCLLASTAARAQDNYEIQVYGSETVARGKTMVETHLNYAFQGSKGGGGLFPTQDALHETLEITHGFSPLFETGFYVFTSARHNQGWRYVGSHVRPRVRVPEAWKWPVGASLSMEFGWQSNRFAEDSWSWEVRPIVDKQLGKWYIALNPAFEKAVIGPNAGRGWGFAPAAKVSFDVTPKVTLGVEYYSSLGGPAHFDPFTDQQHQLFPTIDLNLGEEWEFNAGIGFGLTHSTDRLLVKLIIGRRLNL